MSQRTAGGGTAPLVIRYEVGNHATNLLLTDADQRCLENGRYLRMLCSGLFQRRRASIYDIFQTSEKLQKLIGKIDKSDMAAALKVTKVAFPRAPYLDDDSAADFANSIDKLSDQDLRWLVIGQFAFLVESFGRVADAKVVDDSSGFQISEGVLMANWWLQLIEFAHRKRPGVFENMGVYASLFDPPA